MTATHTLNNLSLTDFVETLSDLCEHSPWVIKRAGQFRPFHGPKHLHSVIVSVIESASLEEKLKLIQAHPHLGTRSKMTAFSQTEQKGAGLNQLSDSQYMHLLQMNEEYVRRFGFPFILAVRGKSKEEILQSIQKRLAHSPDKEFAQALKEIHQIIWFRIQDQIIE